VIVANIQSGNKPVGPLFREIMLYIADRYDRPFDLLFSLGCSLLVLLIAIVAGVLIWTH
jgi:hypothetical protein